MTKRKTGKLVVLEGGVGSGKSTVFERLKKNFKDWAFYREPGSTPFGERIRKAVQGRYGYSVDNYAAMFGYCAARANLVRKKVLPNLKDGKMVVLDRYWFSTYAYQGAEGVSKAEIVKVSMLASDNLMPDLVIHLDQDPVVGIARKEGRKDTDRYDVKAIEFHRKVRKNYHELSELYKKFWVIVDASKDKETVYNNVVSEFENAKII